MLLGAQMGACLIDLGLVDNMVSLQLDGKCYSEFRREGGHGRQGS